MGAKQFERTGLVVDLEHYDAACFNYFVGSDANMREIWQSAYDVYQRQYNDREQGFNARQLAHSIQYLSNYLDLIAKYQAVRCDKNNPKSSLTPHGLEPSPFNAITRNAGTLRHCIDRLMREQHELEIGKGTEDQVKAAKDALRYEGQILIYNIGGLTEMLSEFMQKNAQLGSTEPNNKMAEYMKRAYKEMRALVSQSIEIVAPEEQSVVYPSKMIEGPTALIDTQLKPLSISLLVQRLMVTHKSLYTFMKRHHWTPQRDFIMSPPVMNRKVWILRHEIEQLQHEIEDLQHFANDILRKVPSVAGNLRVERSHDGRQNKLHAVEEGEIFDNVDTTSPPAKGFEIHVVTDEEAASLPSNQPVGVVDPHPKMRPYDAFLSARSGDFDFAKLMTGISGSLDVITPKLKMLTHPGARTSLGKVNNESEAMGRGEKTSHETTDMLVELISKRVNQISDNSSSLINALRSYIITHRENPNNSAFVTLSIDAAEFTSKEVYPRIIQKAERLNQALKELEVLYNKEIGSKPPIQIAPEQPVEAVTEEAAETEEPVREADTEQRGSVVDSFIERRSKALNKPLTKGEDPTGRN